MTEEEWLLCEDPRPMGYFLDSLRKNRPSRRKLRLADCAFYRRLWDLLPAEDRQAIDVVERFADGLAGQAEINVMFQTVWSLAGRTIVGFTRSGKCSAAAFYTRCLLPRDRHDGEAAAQAELMRDIVGNPFGATDWSPNWLSPTVLAVAQEAYEDRELPSGTFAAVHLPVLADALEEAGCEDAPLLAHCRRGGPHVRGCWVVDRVLGRQ